MCGDCCGRGAGGAAEAGAAGAGGGRKRGCAGTALALVALAAAAAVAVLEGTAGGVSYVGDGWLHECAKWDADGRRLLVSNFFGAGVSELRAEAKGKEKEEERVVLADPDVAGRVALGLAVDAPRGRLLIVYADRMPRFGYSAVAAYDLASWRRLFLTRLDGPGGCCRRRGGAGAGAGGTASLAVAALAAAAVVAFLEGTARGVSYVGDGWFHDGVRWDAEGGRFLVTTMTDGRVVEVPGGGGAGAGAGEGKVEARVVVADPGAAGRSATGLTLDAPRRRLLVVYTDLAPWFGYAAVAAYELGSWRRLFLVRLDRPGDSTLADDVAVDEEGNAYVTDAKGNKIWKVSPDGEPLSVIKNATFFQRPGWINIFVGLNGIVYHPNGYLLVIHTSGGDLFKVYPKTGSVHVVKVKGSLKTGDGLALLSPTRLVAAGLVSRLVESDDDWETAAVTGRYVGPAHRIGSSATVKDGDVYINHIIGFGLGKKTHESKFRKNAIIFSTVFHIYPIVEQMVLLIHHSSCDTFKAKEDSATILGNLCNHSEDIRACVESADAVPALLWLLKNGSDNGKEIASKTLNHLIHKSDTGTISQLSALLTSEQPESKVYVLDALKSLLSVAPLNDILHEGSAANDAVETMIKILNSPKEETQAKSASALAGLFHCRKDLRETHIAVKTLWSVMKLIDGQTDKILMAASSCLAAIFLSIKQNKDVAAIGRDALAPLVSLANSTVLEVAEQATRALANLFLDHELSLQVSFEEIIFPIAHVLREGSIDGRTHAAAAIARLLQCRPINQPLSDTINRPGAVLALAGLLEAANGEAAATSEVVDALVLLSKLPKRMQHLHCKAIEVLSRLCSDQHDIVGGLVSEIPGCISSVARRVIGSNMLKVKVGGCALLVCAAKEHCQKQIEILSDSSLYIQLIHSLVSMIHMTNLPSENGSGENISDIKISRHSKENNNSDETVCRTAVISEIPGCISSVARRVIGSNMLKVKVGGCALLVCAAKEHCQKQIEILSDSSLYIQLIHSLVSMIHMTNLPSENGSGENISDIKISRHSKENNNSDETVCRTAVISGNMIPLWLLAVFARHDSKTRAEILEAGAVEMLMEKISQNAFLYVGEEDSTAWVCALLLALLFQEREINRSNAALHSIPVLSNLLRSDEQAYRYFAAQALASLVCNGSRGTLLAVANSGAATGLISLLGCAEVDIADLLELSEESMLVPNPDQITLERLFRVDDIRVGATSRKYIPLLVDLLKPIPERPGAPFLALGLLTQLAIDCPPNMMLMAEAGILEALTKYLSLSPQDATEEATTDLLGILFSCAQK
uniref:Uncharacterized protein n=1 Tax=Oryza meridionalis TaxID=40149 RepID=A0A0E0CZI6_9ORYZ